MKKHFNDARGNWSRRLLLFSFLAIFSSAALAQSPAAPEEKPAHPLNPMQIALLK